MSGVATVSLVLKGFRRRRFERELARGIPDVSSASEAPSDEPAPPGGPEVYRLDDDEPWSVRDEGLADRLGVRSNHEAERRVQAILAEAAPVLLARAEFDSESDCFFAYFESQADAIALREILLGMSR